MAGRWSSVWPRWIALAALTIDACLVLVLIADAETLTVSTAPDVWLADLKWTWIPRFGIAFHLALDGLSLLLVALTVFLGFYGGVLFLDRNQTRQRLFSFQFAVDPGWRAGRVSGFGSVSVLFLLGSHDYSHVFSDQYLGPRKPGLRGDEIFSVHPGQRPVDAVRHRRLGLCRVSEQRRYFLRLFDLLNATLEPGTAFWLMLGFFIAFVVKLPAVPFHTWLPDAHTQASTAGSVILAGVLLKTGAYGLVRFVVPLFPEAAYRFTPFAMLLGVVSILYGAKLAFAQSDIKRLIAYTSISHMGFILLGVFAWNAIALQGAVMTMLAHGISSAALFMIAGGLQERIHTRDMGRMGGLWGEVPRLAAIALFFSVAALGMPGLGNFIGEFLVLLGAFQVDSAMTVVAALGLIVAPIYSLIVIQKAFHGVPKEHHTMVDFGAREMTAMGFMVVAMVWMGLYPQAMMALSDPVVVENVNRIAALTGQ